MSPEERREMIVRAVLPLVSEHGNAVTTAQIAKAAGIGEGTIFRAFKDKDELIDACVAEALRADTAIELIYEIPLELPVERRLLEAADVLQAYLQRMGAVMGALHSSGRPAQRGKRGKGGREESFAAMGEAISFLLQPEQVSLRLPVEKAGRMFLSLLFARSRSMPDAVTAEQLIDLFLHGAVAAG
jgi:AcrR family transcriptional regulator